MMVNRADRANDVAALGRKAIDDFDEVAPTVGQAKGDEFIGRDIGGVSSKRIAHLNHLGQTGISLAQQGSAILSGMVTP